MTDRIDLSYVQLKDGCKIGNPCTLGSGNASKTSVLQAKDLASGEVLMKIWKDGDTLFARSPKTGKTKCAPWANVATCDPIAPSEQATVQQQQGKR